MMMLLFLLFLLYRLALPQSSHYMNRIILMGGEHPCEGHVAIYHKSQWGYVGDALWSANNDQVVCRSTHCGEPVGNSTEYVFRPAKSIVWLNEVVCNGTEKSLLNCQHPGWEISDYRKRTVKKIKCSNKIKIKLDGFRCVGAVQYSTDGTTYSGYFCNQKWGQDESNTLCASLNCGQAKATKPLMTWKGFKNAKKMVISCSGSKQENNLWQCVTEESQCQQPAAVECTGHERLQLRGNQSNVCSGQLEREVNKKWELYQVKQINPELWCEQMHCGRSVHYSRGDNVTQLTCSDKVEVLLLDKKKQNSCFGVVHVKVNDSTQPVCGNNWSKKDAQVVCKTLGCGVMIHTYTVRGVKGIVDNVTCLGNESSLWHCRALHDDRSFKCSSNVYVVCAGSVSVRLVDSPGSNCAGRLEIQYENIWKNVNKNSWKRNSADKICKLLDCGNAFQPAVYKTFSKGSGNSLAATVDCPPATSHISDCIKVTSNRQIDEQQQAVGIICEEHEVVFLKGNKSCSGTVGIMQNNKIFSLSGSQTSWTKSSANAVCAQVNCGTAVEFNAIPKDMNSNVYNASYMCLPNSTSLFACEKDILPLEQADTIATVTCSGNIVVNLTNGCWGHVNICMEGECGGLCADLWEKNTAVILCEHLNCGNKALQVPNGIKEINVIFKSLHMAMETNNLTNSNFIRFDGNDSSCDQDPAYVVCSGSVKAKLTSRDKCTGNLRLKYKNQWLPVCKQAINDIATQNAICSDMGCGHTVAVLDYFGPNPTESHAISNIQCNGGDKSLKNCDITIERMSCLYGGIKCSKWAKIALQNGKDDTCSGAAFVFSMEDYPAAVSAEGWTEKEGNRLCKDLNCDSFKSKEHIAANSFWNKSFHCEDGKHVENIWDCETPNTTSQKEQLYIECQGENRANMSHKCYGKVTINDLEVCESHWNYSDLLCQEMGCSNAIEGSISSSKRKTPSGEYYHVLCEDYHHKLGQCERYKAKCNKGPVSVYCVGNIKFRTTETCGGQIEIDYRDKWEKVCVPSHHVAAVKARLCRKPVCVGEKKTIPRGNETFVGNLNITLQCREESTQIQHCVHHKMCSDNKPAVIYCNGPSQVKEEVYKPPLLAITLGVGFLLVALIMLIVFVRICISLRARSLNITSKNEIEFDRTDYEEVPSKANEMDDLSQTRFQTEAEALMDNAEQSISSYDDIDEAAEAQPLAPQAGAAHISGHDCPLDVITVEKPDGVSYEVEDPQKSYYNMEVSREITTTQAEVHNSLQTTSGGDAAASSELDDDYIVPSEDG